MEQIPELVGFLSDPKAEVRLIAASHLLTLDLTVRFFFSFLVVGFSSIAFL